MSIPFPAKKSLNAQQQIRRHTKISQLSKEQVLHQIYHNVVDFKHGCMTAAAAAANECMQRREAKEREMCLAKKKFLRMSVTNISLTLLLLHESKSNSMTGPPSILLLYLDSFVFFSHINWTRILFFPSLSLLTHTHTISLHHVCCYIGLSSTLAD